jgi:hypothetical protein
MSTPALAALVAACKIAAIGSILQPRSIARHACTQSTAGKPPCRSADLTPPADSARNVRRYRTLSYHRAFRADPGRLGLTFWQKSPPTRFGQRYRDQLSRADNVTVLLHATLVGMVTNERGDRIERCDLRSLQGRAVSSRGAAYVLA